MKSYTTAFRSFIASISLLALSLTASSAVSGPPLSPAQSANADSFRKMKHGIFIHDVYRLTCWPDDRKVATLDEFAAAFDTADFAHEMAAIGVEYVYFTAWHKGVYLLAPNAALEEWLPGHTAKRDLIGPHGSGLLGPVQLRSHPSPGTK